MAEPLVEVRRLRKYFPIRGGLLHREVGAVRTVDGIDLDIPRGETVGLVGESGCGKTTAGRTILGLTRPTEGTVYYRFPFLRPEERELFRPVVEGVRPIGLTLLTMIMFVAGLGSLVFGASLLTAPSLVPAGFLRAFGIFFGYPMWFGAYAAVGGALSVFLAGALWDLDRWARLVTIAKERHEGAHRYRLAEVGARPKALRSATLAACKRRRSAPSSERPARFAYRLSIDMADWRIPGGRSIALDVSRTLRTHRFPADITPTAADRAIS